MIGPKNLTEKLKETLGEQLGARLEYLSDRAPYPESKSAQYKNEPNSLIVYRDRLLFWPHGNSLLGFDPETHTVETLATTREWRIMRAAMCWNGKLVLAGNTAPPGGGSVPVVSIWDGSTLVDEYKGTTEESVIHHIGWDGTLMYFGMRYKIKSWDPSADTWADEVDFGDLLGADYDSDKCGGFSVIGNTVYAFSLAKSSQQWIIKKEGGTWSVVTSDMPQRQGRGQTHFTDLFDSSERVNFGDPWDFHGGKTYMLDFNAVAQWDGSKLLDIWQAHPTVGNLFTHTPKRCGYYVLWGGARIGDPQTACLWSWDGGRVRKHANIFIDCHNTEVFKNRIYMIGYGPAYDTLDSDDWETIRWDANRVVLISLPIDILSREMYEPRAYRIWKGFSASANTTYYSDDHEGVLIPCSEYRSKTVWLHNTESMDWKVQMTPTVREHTTTCPEPRRAAFRASGSTGRNTTSPS